MGTSKVAIKASLNSPPAANNSSKLWHNQLRYRQKPNTIKAYVIDAADTFSISIDMLVKATGIKRSTMTTKLVNQINSYPLTGKVTKFSNLASTFPRDNFNSQLPFRRVAFGKKKTKSSICTETISTDTFSHTNTNANTKTPNKISNTPHKQSNTQPTPFSSFNYYSLRILTLFLLGSFTSLIIDHLLTQNKHATYPGHIVKFVNTAIWIPPTCGLSAVLVGSLFPLADYWCEQKPKELRNNWSNVMRCTGGLVGVAYTATKLSCNNNSQVSLTLALISVVLWFLFDRTIHGLLMSLLFATVGTCATCVLVSNGIYNFTHADFLGVRSWISCILYSSCICLGTVGRQLVIVPESSTNEKY